MHKETIKLNISGMTCVNCSNGIERVVGKLPGLQSAKVNFAANIGEFVVDSESLDKQTIIQKIKKLGYGVQEDIEALENAKKIAYKKQMKLFFLSLFITILMFALMFFSQSKNTIYAIFALASVVQFYPGGRFYSLAFKALRSRNYDMNVLVALGTSAAYGYSAAVTLAPQIFAEHLRFVYFDGASVIITFVLLGRLLEERSRTKATDFLKNLINLAPQSANKIQENGDLQTIPAKELHVGDIVLIKQGEKVSTDGRIIEGNADIDTSMITGEPMPVFKSVGDEVTAGTLIYTGVLKVRVLKSADETTLSQIIALLGDAQSKKMPIARLADKIANIFVPSVIAISILTFFVWYIFVGDVQSAILASISVLIISCPCALGLATPIAIVGAVGRGAKEGILIKNPEILEIIKDIKYAVFDKTGTLTQGKISVKESSVPSEYLSLLGSIEQQSEHPISKAIVSYAQQNDFAINKKVEELRIIAGNGVSATSEGKKVLIGNLDLLERNNVSLNTEQKELFERNVSQGFGVIFASINATCIGLFVLEDSIKAGAKELIEGLRKNSIIPVLLTGDNEQTAKSVATKIGIDLVYAGVMPDKKYKVIKELQANAKVLFVGDGINDSVSIKQADIGIAMNSGSDITKDAGDIILMNSELKSVLETIKLSQKSMQIIKQNLFWAFFYNSIGIPIAAGVLYPFFGIMLTPVYAGIAMSFSSVSVVLNSLRLKIIKL